MRATSGWRTTSLRVEEGEADAVDAAQHFDRVLQARTSACLGRSIWVRSPVITAVLP